MRDVIIIAIILAIIFGGAIFTEKYLSKTIEDLNQDLSKLKEEVILAKETGDRDYIKEEAKKIDDKWESIEEKWSIIVLHDELDKIKISFTEMKSGIEHGELDKSLEDLETAIFLVNHIGEKERFSLKNIF